MRSLIVGTAGHIDHGKSALVRALTGTDPDRLPEEKKRGITIDLGFADLTLNDLRLGFVDVPGHERFIKNMLAGAHGIDLLALVIAADEGVMPQTREHFDICRLLGVEQGLVVITKKDLVEDEMLLLVEDEARDLVSGSFLAEAPIITVSSRTGEGLDDLRSQLTEAGRRARPRSSEFVMRLPVDRAFTMKGFGAVVTGTLIADEIAEGEELELLPKKLPVRVRGIQVHGQSVQRARAGQRTAVNLAGVDVAEIERGMVLAPAGILSTTQIVDVKLNVLPGAARGIRSRARLRVHAGAAEVLARARILEDINEIAPGQSGLVQLRFESPIVMLHGDRFIVRSYSPAETLGGGIVLDPLASKHRQKDFARVREHLLELTVAEKDKRLLAFVTESGSLGIRTADITAATAWKPEIVKETLAKLAKTGAIVDVGGVLVSKESFKSLSDGVVNELARHHQREPLARGMLRETLREKIFSHSLPELFGATLSRLESEGKLVSDKDAVRLSEHKVDLSDDEAKLRHRLEEIYLQAKLEVPTIEEVMQKAAVKPNERAHARKLLQLLIEGGKLVRVQPELFIHQEIADDLRKSLWRYADEHEPDRLIDVATFKELAGVSRKYAIPLLEFLDRERVTRRAGDKRLILNSS